MRILIACEYSGIVRNELSKLGHSVTSCDILPTDSPGKHYQGDVLDILYDGWDMMIAHPPCTFLCNSGVRWLTGNPERWYNLGLATTFFNMLLSSNIPKIAIENPIPHKHAKLPRYSQIIQPYHFGHTTSKSTCLWLKGLPPLMSTLIQSKITYDIHKEPPELDRAKKRSKTFLGIAQAMATQWG